MFLPYNCTTTGRDLADSQLFGHRRGAFTGAVSDQPGLVRTAAGGTLFLDEIGDLPLDVQPKLLRFLEQYEIMPIGETQPQRVDVRVLAATNADLEQRVAEGKFREDLYYRLERHPHSRAAAARAARRDPAPEHVLPARSVERLGKPDIHLSSEALDVFSQYWWPGNVRQLKNEIQRAVALSAPGGTSSRPTSRPRSCRRGCRRASGSIRIAADDAEPGVGGRTVERDMIQAALDRAGGNISETARTLGLTRRGLYLKLRRLGLDSPAEVDAH